MSLAFSKSLVTLTARCWKVIVMKSFPVPSTTKGIPSSRDPRTFPEKLETVGIFRGADSGGWVLKTNRLDWNEMVVVVAVFFVLFCVFGCVFLGDGLRDFSLASVFKRLQRWLILMSRVLLLWNVPPCLHHNKKTELGVEKWKGLLYLCVPYAIGSIYGIFAYTFTIKINQM